MPGMRHFEFMKPMLVQIGYIALAVSALAQNEAKEPNVGEAPPPLRLGKLLQAPAEAKSSWAALKGKVVVLEFWAT